MHTRTSPKRIWQMDKESRRLSSQASLKVVAVVSHSPDLLPNLKNRGVATSPRESNMLCIQRATFSCLSTSCAPRRISPRYREKETNCHDLQE